MGKAERLTVSLPGEMVRSIKRAAKESGMKVSSLVASALEQYLGMEDVSPKEIRVYPTVLWKIRGRGRIRGPSLRAARTKVGVWRLVELDRVPV